MNLKEKRAKLIEEAQQLSAKEDLSAEELVAMNAKLDEADALAKQIKASEDAQVRLVAHVDDLKKSSGRVVPAEVSAVARVERVEEGWKQDPKKGYRSPRQFLAEVLEVGMGKARPSAQLKFLATAGSDEAGTYSDPYGGFLLPEGFSPQLLKIDAESDPIAGRTTNVPMSSTRLSIPARVDKTHTSSVSGGLRVYRRAETDTVTASRMQFEQVALVVHTLFGLSYASEEILTDSPISFAALLSAGFGDEFTSKIIDERLNGTGVGEFLGINNGPALVSVTKETGQAADTLVYENIIKMRARVWGYANAVWMANHDCLPQLMLLNQSVGTAGVPVWQPSAREDHPDMLMGRPLVFHEALATLGDAGDIICANWSQYLEGTYQPLQSAESIHVRFVNHERTFKFWLRNAGAPWWNAALTPKKSSSTLSPFVRLAERA